MFNASDNNYLYCIFTDQIRERNFIDILYRRPSHQIVSISFYKINKKNTPPARDILYRVRCHTRPPVSSAHLYLHFTAQRKLTTLTYLNVVRSWDCVPVFDSPGFSPR
jgi:hypothetical protein